MELVVAATERTTAATDALQALAAAVAILIIRRGTAPSLGRAVWQSALAALMLASALGAIAHGLALATSTRELLWQPLFLSLGVVMALFVVGAVRDWRGDGAGRRALPGAVAMAAAVAVSLAVGGVQASRMASIRFLWEFDPNGLFHLVQLVGLTLMVAGLVRLLPPTTPAAR
ncbi:MAG: hypothetical protein H0T86_07935 [Gemmatimonadales bacterium]|nr:hypothetical protein [Gemmatimonadales bacterium]